MWLWFNGNKYYTEACVAACLLVGGIGTRVRGEGRCGAAEEAGRFVFPVFFWLGWWWWCSDDGWVMLCSCDVENDFAVWGG